MRESSCLFAVCLAGLITAGAFTAGGETMDWKIIELTDAAARRSESGRDYLEFLRVPAMNAGLYELPAGGRDPQKPHEQDEIYHVVSGRAVFTVAGESRPVRAGSVIYVRAGVEHRFEAIEEDLRVLVIFAGD